MAEAKPVDFNDLAKALTSIDPYEAANKAPEKAGEKMKGLLDFYAKHKGSTGDAKFYTEFRSLIEPLVELKDGVVGLKEGADTKALEEAIKKNAGKFGIAEGEQTVEGILNHYGKAKSNLQALAESEEMSKGGIDKLKSLSSKLGGLTGMLETEGVLKTAQHNLTHFEGRPGQAFGRIAGTGLCALGVSDSLFRSKTNNGEDRSVVTRFGELALFGAGAAALVLANKAHMPKVATV